MGDILWFAVVALLLFSDQIFAWLNSFGGAA